MAIVSISRGSFVGATFVAEQLASDLKIPGISKDVIIDAAREGGDGRTRLWPKTAERYIHNVDRWRGKWVRHWFEWVSLELVKGGELFTDQLDFSVENNVFTISGKAIERVAKDAVGDAKLRFKVEATMNEISWQV